MKEMTVKDLAKLLQEQIKLGRGDIPAGYIVTGYNPKTKKLAGGDLWGFSKKDIYFFNSINVGPCLALGTLRLKEVLTNQQLRKIAGKANALTFESVECNMSRALEHFYERYDFKESMDELLKEGVTAENLKGFIYAVIEKDLKELIELYNDFQGLNDDEMLLCMKEKEDACNN